MTVLAVLALGACTGGEPGDPRTFPPYTAPASPSETPSPTPTPDAATPPERPDMSAVDAETAEAVAVYFLQLFPYVYATGDLSDWDLLSHSECIYCADTRASVEAMMSEGNHSTGGLSALLGTTTTQVSDRMWAVRTTLLQDPSQTVSQTGEVVEDFPEQVRYDFEVIVTRESSWLIRGVSYEVAG